VEPTAVKLGQIYLDENTKQLRFYNGTEFVTLGATGNTNIVNNDNSVTTNITNIISAGSGGVTSLQGTTGDLTLSNATLLGTTITIDDASTSAKGIASFNNTNFSVVTGDVNTAQDIATTSSPQFAGINFKNGGGGAVTLQSSASSGALTFTLPSADGGASECLTTNGAGLLSFSACSSGAGTAFVQGGNSFGATAVLGTNDAYDLIFETHNSTKLTIQDSTGNVGIGTTTIGTNNRLIVNAYSTVDNAATAQINTNAVGNKGLVVQGFNGQTASLFEVQGYAGGIFFKVGPGGAVLSKPAADSSTAFQVQNAAGNTLFNIDTSAGVIGTLNQTLGSTNSVAINLQSGAVSGATSNSGSLTLKTGNSSTSGNTGDISITTGNATAGNSGSIYINAGSATGTTGSINIGTTGTNAITLGATSNTGSIILGQSTAGETINIGNGNVASGNTNTINIGATATATGKDIITIGNTAGASSLTLQAGTAGISMNSTAASGIGINNVADATTTGTAFNFQANALTTGIGMQISTTSPSLSTSIVKIIDNPTFTTSTATSSTDLTVTRTLNANVTAGITLDTTCKSDVKYGSGSPETYWGCGVTDGIDDSVDLMPVSNIHPNRVLLIYIDAQGATSAPSAITYNGSDISSKKVAEKINDINGNVYSAVYALMESDLQSLGSNGNYRIKVNWGSGRWSTVDASLFYNVDQTTALYSGSYSPEPVVTMVSANTVTGSINPSATTDAVVHHAFGATTNGNACLNAPSGNATTYTPVIASYHSAQNNNGVASEVYSSPAVTPTTNATVTTCGSNVKTLIQLSMHKASLGAVTATGNLVTFSATCQNTAGGCLDTSNILSLQQLTSNSTGAVLGIQNSGLGADIQLGAGNIQTAVQTTTSANSTGVNLQSGAVSGATSNSGSLTLKTGNSSTSGNTGDISITTGNATAGNSGNISINAGSATGTTGSINIGTTGNNIVTIGSNNAAGSTTLIQGGNGATAIQLQTAAGGTIGIGNNAVANTVNIATANGANNTTVAIGNGVTGNSNTASVTVGSNNAAASTTLIQGGSGATAIQLIPNNSGAILIGGSGQTGAITIGQSTDTQTINIGTGATASGKTLTIHIGDAGVAGSTTNITIGSTIAGTVTVQSAATFNKAITLGGHVISANTTGATTITAGAASCTSPTVMTVTGNDTAGLISVTTGTGCAATGVLGTVTFANAYGSAPRIMFTPTNANATGLNYYNGATSTTTFTLDTNTIPVDATSYTYNYFVIQ